MVNVGAVADPVNVTAVTLAVLAAAERDGNVAKEQMMKAVAIAIRRLVLTRPHYSD